MMANNLNLESPYKVPDSLSMDVYPLRWRPVSVETPPDISGLPSIDDALYLFNTVKHHLDQHYRFFDEENFTRYLNEFYSGNSLQKATENRLWFVHFLLVLAFGNAFLLRSRNTQDPPGSKFFLRAMSLLPDHTDLWTEGLLAVEVLALAGLYLYSVDHRESAHVYVLLLLSQPSLFFPFFPQILTDRRSAKLFELRNLTGCIPTSLNMSLGRGLWLVAAIFGGHSMSWTGIFHPH